MRSRTATLLRCDVKYAVAVGGFVTSIWVALITIAVTFRGTGAALSSAVVAVAAGILGGWLSGALLAGAVALFADRSHLAEGAGGFHAKVRGAFLVSTVVIIAVLFCARFQHGYGDVALWRLSPLQLGAAGGGIGLACLVAARSCFRWSTHVLYAWQVMWLVLFWLLWDPFNKLYQAPVWSRPSVLANLGYIGGAIAVYFIIRWFLKRLWPRQRIDSVKPCLLGTVVTAAAALLVAWLGSGTAPAASSASPAPPRGLLSADELSRLRSLPYLGFTEDRVDEGRAGVVHFDAERSYPGYNLYTNRKLCSAVLINSMGDVVQSWHVPSMNPEAQSEPPGVWWHSELLPNGDLLVVGCNSDDDAWSDGSDDSHYILRLSWNGDTLFGRWLAAHHDIEMTPSGRILTLTARPRLVPRISTTPIIDRMLALLSPEGSIIEEISLYDALAADPDVFTFQEVKPWPKNGGDRIDLFHANSIEWMHHEHLCDKHPIYGQRNVLVCMRHQDSIAIVNWDRKEVVWAWGQGEVSGPHDATVLENGNILLFDNGINRQWSRVIELDPLTRRIVWEYKAPTPTDFFTLCMGHAQRLPNGNTLITNSESGQAFEVTQEGHVVWDFLNTDAGEHGHRSVITRMQRYEVAYIESILKQHEHADH